jgi:tripartite-type tricarboxylate transporter receptor subunit TctC
MLRLAFDYPMLMTVGEAMLSARKARGGIAMKTLIASGVAALALVAGWPAAATAQEWPTRPVRLVVPFPPGGAADYVGRLYGDFLARQIGQPVVIENRAGAGGVIGTTHVAKAAPDGYTLVLGSFSTHNTMTFMLKNPPYDPQKDFTPISLVARVPTILVTTAKLPVNTVSELVALARQKPGTLNYGSVGHGTTMHLSGEVFSREAKIDIVHVPYKGQSQMVPDLATGEIHLIFNNYTSTIGMVQSGQVKVLAVALEERWPDLPNVPTFAEVGLPDVKISSWTAVFAPAGLPAEIAAKLEKASVAFGKDADSRQKLIRSGNLPVGGTATELRRFVSEQIEYWSDVARSANIQPE